MGAEVSKCGGKGTNANANATATCVQNEFRRVAEDVEDNVDKGITALKAEARDLQRLAAEEIRGIRAEGRKGKNSRTIEAMIKDIQRMLEQNLSKVERKIAEFKENEKAAKSAGRNAKLALREERRANSKKKMEDVKKLQVLYSTINPRKARDIAFNKVRQDIKDNPEIYSDDLIEQSFSADYGVHLQLLGFEVTEYLLDFTRSDESQLDVKKEDEKYLTDDRYKASEEDYIRRLKEVRESKSSIGGGYRKSRRLLKNRRRLTRR